jgi:hypothetical protein
VGEGGILGTRLAGAFEQGREGVSLAPDQARDHNTSMRDGPPRSSCLALAKPPTMLPD